MARTVNILDDENSALECAVEALAAGEPIGLPTETVYGLAADATSGSAVARIFDVKGRPRFNPLICHMADLAMAEQYVAFDPVSRRLAETFWPGPLTLVLPIVPQSEIAGLTRAGLDTLAVRVPGGFAQRLIARYGRPLAAPSANTSGRVSPTRAGHVEADIGSKISLILDGGPASVGVESTIVKVEAGQAVLLRPGGISADAIEERTGVSLSRRDTHGAVEAPGMLASHYAPNASMRIDVDTVHPGEVLLTFAGARLAGDEDAQRIIDLSPSGDLAEAAAQLFDVMNWLDAHGVEKIAVVPIPHEGLGEAINDRLTRAAAPRG